MKVAQYEVLGWRSEKAIRPARDDRRLRLRSLGKLHGRDEEPTVLSSLPGRTSFLHNFPALRTGLLSLRPSGTGDTPPRAPWADPSLRNEPVLSRFSNNQVLGFLLTLVPLSDGSLSTRC